MAELNLFVSLLILGLVVVIYVRVKPFVVEEEWKDRPLGIKKEHGFKFKAFGKPKKKRVPVINDDTRAWEKEHDINPDRNLQADL